MLLEVYNLMKYRDSLMKTKKQEEGGGWGGRGRLRHGRRSGYEASLVAGSDTSMHGSSYEYFVRCASDTSLDILHRRGAKRGY